METLLQGLLVAGITAFATFASTWLSYNYRISKDLSSLSGGHKDLSKEHVELRGDLGKKHVELREAISQKIQSASDGIKNYLEAERREQDRKLAELKQNKLLEIIQQGSMASEVVWKEYLEMQIKLRNLQIDYDAALARIEQLEYSINIANQTRDEEWELEL